MSHQVRIEPAGRILTVEDSETILDAALRSGVALPYSCRGGSCGTCKSKLLAGRVDYGQYEDRAMSAAEREAGSVLICQAKPLSDVVIEARVLEQAADIPIRILPCRVVGLERAAPDVMVVSLKLPEHERFQYLAGQYIDILLRDSARRSFSLAHAPGRDELLELHIRQVPGGLFTTHVFEKLKERDLLRFQGPYGSFFLREGSSPVILVAGGTGFAPMQAIIEQVLAAQPDRPLHLYWARAPGRISIGMSWPNAGRSSTRISVTRPCCRNRTRRMPGAAAPASCTRRCWPITRTCRGARFIPAGRRSWSNPSAANFWPAGCRRTGCIPIPSNSATIAVD